MSSHIPNRPGMISKVPSSLLSKREWHLKKNKQTFVRVCPSGFRRQRRVPKIGAHWVHPMIIINSMQ
jgi:hypothetical protein